MIMTTPTKEHARNFMKYGFDTTEGYLPYEDARDVYSDSEIFRLKIMDAAHSHLNDIAFAFEIPKADRENFGVEIYDDRDNLSVSTLRILAEVMTARTNTN
jgi:hypothetical protein